jgi:hypothetical protein
MSNITAETLLAEANRACEEGFNFVYNSLGELKDTDFPVKMAAIIDQTVKMTNEMAKEASFMSGLKSHGKDIAKGVGGAALTGVAVSMLNDLVTNAHESLTRSRNYNKMLEYAPELKEHEDPKLVRGIFDSLHTLAGPKVTGEPHIAAEFVRTQASLAGAGGGFSNAKNISDLVGTRKNIDSLGQRIAPPQMGYTSSMSKERRRDQDGKTQTSVSSRSDKSLRV